jgi:hypothetical protein
MRVLSPAPAPNTRVQRTHLRHLFAEALAKVERYGGQARLLELSRSPLSRKPFGEKP